MVRNTYITAAAALLLLLAALPGQAMIDGLEGNSFQFTAKDGHISTPDGPSVYFWGYSDDNGSGAVQYPGPTLILEQGVPVTIELRNTIPDKGTADPTDLIPVSIVFPGQSVMASGGQEGLLTREAVLPTDVVTYEFTPAEPGTYLYHSGTRPDLQIEMGLFGAIIVRPIGFDPMMPAMRKAYAEDWTRYDREFLFLQSEMDVRPHKLAEFGHIDQIDTADYFPVWWFLNGRCAMDTMGAPGTELLEAQPYNCMPMMHPGEKVLMRVIGAGRDLHPFHHHGNDSTVIARDGRVLKTAGGATSATQRVFTIQTVPGETVDALFEWTGEGLGWDIYGHAPGDPLQPYEDPNDHGKPFPVVLPEQANLTFGGLWSGSPFLGALGALPPGEGGLNPNGGYTYMWHSHTEKELCNYDIFPGGLMTMLIIEHWDVDLGMH